MVGKLKYLFPLARRGELQPSKILFMPTCVAQCTWNPLEGACTLYCSQTTLVE